MEDTHINLYTPSTLKEELLEAGFTQIKVSDSPSLLLGNSKPGGFLMRMLFKMFPIDFLSATANCVAYK